jgi:hypothetical protein
MDWIKRNLGFVLGALIALVLLAGAGWYNYTRYTTYTAAREKLNADYDELKRLYGLQPSPGTDKVDNIKLAREQEQEIRAQLGKLARHFQPIPPVVNHTTNAAGQLTVTGEDYAAALRQVLDQLQKEAVAGSVTLPPKYAFSFEAQRSLIKFAPGSLEPLAIQLAEVRTLVSLLNRAKVNALEGLRRERVSADDATGPVTDYLDRASVTNDLAILTPYEITFRCFSPELAAVLSAFAASPHSLVVKGFNVEPAVAGGAIDPATGQPMVPDFQPPAPVYIPQPIPQQPALQPRGPVGEESALFARRYGGGNKGAFNPPPIAAPQMPVPTVAPVAVPRVQTVLDERQLKVTMLVYIIKPLPPKN